MWFCGKRISNRWAVKVLINYNYTEIEQWSFGSHGSFSTYINNNINKVLYSYFVHPLGIKQYMI